MSVQTERINKSNAFDEYDRLENLYSYKILDSLPEKEYEELVMIAAAICNMPVSLISLIDKDRQWSKAAFGFSDKEMSRDISFCAHAIQQPEVPLVVPNAKFDNRFKKNPLVTTENGINFYAGFPLISTEGFPLGTLCVIDFKPNELTDTQITALQALANQASKLLELRKTKEELNKNLNALEVKNNDLEQLARIAAHDLKAPLANISSLIDVLLRYYTSNLNDNVIEMLELINNSSRQLRNLIDGILEYSRNQKVLSTEKEVVFLPTFFQSLMNHINPQNQHNIQFNAAEREISINKPALHQILSNLISNAIRYNDKEIVEISIDHYEKEDKHCFRVTDNGKGIGAENLERVFTIFEVLELEDRFGERGSGVGLAIVKRLIEGQGGNIKIESIPGEGTEVKLEIPK